MNEVEVVQKRNAAEKLSGECLNVGAREWHEPAGFEKVEDREAKEGCDDANVAAPVEALTQLDAAISVVLIGGAQSLKNSKLDATSITILRHKLALRHKHEWVRMIVPLGPP